MTEQEVRKFIASKAKALGSMSALAKQIDVSAAYLSDVVNGRRAPGEAILYGLDLERVVTYRKRTA